MKARNNLRRAPQPRVAAATKDTACTAALPQRRKMNGFGPLTSQLKDARPADPYGSSPRGSQMFHFGDVASRA